MPFSDEVSAAATLNLASMLDASLENPPDVFSYDQCLLLIRFMDLQAEASLNRRHLRDAELQLRGLLLSISCRRPTERDPLQLKIEIQKWTRMSALAAREEIVS